MKKIRHKKNHFSNIKNNKLTREIDNAMSCKRFIKRKENFICENCETLVRGTGYTNHCPKCLWSKHVDIYPGDRRSECGGMMEPIGVEIKHGEYILIHRCIKCGCIKKNVISPEDNFEEILKLVQKRINR